MSYPHAKYNILITREGELYSNGLCVWYYNALVSDKVLFL